MNYRELLNRTCRVTGDELIDCSITELTDDRHIQLGEFFNQIKEEIEGAHNWRALQQHVNVTIEAGFAAATVDESIARSSRVVRIHDAAYGRLVPLVFDVTNESNAIPLREMDLSLLTYKLLQDGPTATAQHPQAYAVTADALGLQVHVWPRVSEDRDIRLVMVVPQGYLDTDDVNTEILVPNRALLLGTIWYTLQERGEELGLASMYTEERYRTALNDEISVDSAEQGEFELVPV